ncbi:TetR/AcrR family transcriptional regulator [Chitinophaga sp. 30R24]|uniref:TetR/AcrR family transcriptional regulator n=1 Tax=Chitinophaga sp. 30R24 TaxID=3248838 RepID=UPI003B8F9BA4
MGSKARIQRLKENTRSNILKAALHIVKQEGWPALSMRRIAEEIDYTAPVIYEYFTGKESLMAELSNTGYQLLVSQIIAAKEGVINAIDQWQAMWLAYWQFAFAEKELYQAMFGMEVHCSSSQEVNRKSDEVAALFMGVIKDLTNGKNITDEQICTRYLMCWSVIHGLISINLVNKVKAVEINQHVLHEAIQGVITSIIK